VFMGKGIMSELDLGVTGNTASFGIVHNVRRRTRALGNSPHHARPLAFAPSLPLIHPVQQCI
jgi:hypothetical protein